MKNFKKILALVLAIGMVFALAACGEKKDDIVKVGALEGSGMDSMRSEEHWTHLDIPNSTNTETIYYSNLSAALMDLESGKIFGLGVEGCVADYIVARNEKVVASKKNEAMTNFSMMTLDTN